MNKHESLALFSEQPLLRWSTELRTALAARKKGILAVSGASTGILTLVGLVLAIHFLVGFSSFEHALSRITESPLANTDLLKKIGFIALYILGGLVGGLIALSLPFIGYWGYKKMRAYQLKQKNLEIERQQKLYPTTGGIPKEEL